MRIYLDMCCYNRPYDLIREKLDYTKWQRQYFDAMLPNEFSQKALEYAHKHPYIGSAERL